MTVGMASGDGEARHRQIFLLLVVIASLFATEAWPFLVVGGHPRPSDFEVFHIAGRLTLEGRLAEAYDGASLAAVQQEMRGRVDSLAFGYPPPFALVLAPLGLVPRGLGFVLFMGTTLALFLWILVRLGGARAAPALLVALLPVYVNLLCGQNGFLTGALVGMACLGLCIGHRAAGVPLGLMIIKPHLALGVGLYVLARRDWRTLGVAVATALAMAAAATLLLGPGIWSAFFAGLAEQGTAMAQGLYRSYRMQSPFAALMSVHLPLAAAWAAQGVAALAAGGLILVAARRLPLAAGLGLAVLAWPQFSPYGYDYDLPVAAVGTALLSGPLLARLPRWQALAVLALLPAAALIGLVNLAGVDPAAPPAGWPPGPGGVLMLLALWLAALPLLRQSPPTQ